MEKLGAVGRNTESKASEGSCVLVMPAGSVRAAALTGCVRLRVWAVLLGRVDRGDRLFFSLNLPDCFVQLSAQSSPPEKDLPSPSTCDSPSQLT